LIIRLKKCPLLDTCLQIQKRRHCSKRKTKIAVNSNANYKQSTATELLAAQNKAVWNIHKHWEVEIWWM